jgi:hypothetical protein
MPRPRKDYIVLDKQNATIGADGEATWQIQPYMYTNWKPGDELTMKLISASTLLASGDIASMLQPSIKYYGAFTSQNQYNLSGKTLLGVSDSTVYHGDIGAGTDYYLTAGLLQSDTPELFCDKLSNVTIYAHVAYNSLINLGSNATQFMFEVKYYPQSE